MKPVSAETKKKIQNIIFERAYEFESRLAADNYFKAKLAGLKPEQVPDVALKLAIKELKETFKKDKTLQI